MRIPPVENAFPECGRPARLSCRNQFPGREKPVRTGDNRADVPCRVFVRKSGGCMICPQPAGPRAGPLPRPLPGHVNVPPPPGPQLLQGARDGAGRRVPAVGARTDHRRRGRAAAGKREAVREDIQTAPHGRAACVQDRVFLQQERGLLCAPRDEPHELQENVSSMPARPGRAL